MMNKTMLAVVYRGKGDIRLEERPVPRLLEPGDAIVRVEGRTRCLRTGRTAASRFV